ncbi:MAG: HEAT repeat domain-containing protein [Phycisphaerae bacterium]|nr:HEAT repeat domain-containing protein [Phycisphaerae bacterium]
MKRIIIAMTVVWAVVMGLLLFHPGVRVRYWAWRMMMSDQSAVRRHFAARLESRPAQSLAVAGRLLDHDDREIRAVAVVIADASQEPASQGVLLEALHDADASIRDAAALALGRRGDVELVRELARLATDEDPPVAAAAVFALQRDAGGQAVEAILGILSDADSVEVRVQAIESLGLLGVDRARPILTEMLGDRRSVTSPPANERCLWRGLAAQHVTLDLSAGQSIPSSQAGAKRVGDYAGEALRRLDRDSRASTLPATSPSRKPTTTSRSP